MVPAEVDSGSGRFRRRKHRRDPERPRNLKRMRERDDHRQAHRIHRDFPRKNKRKRMRVAGCSHRKWAYSPCDLSSYNDRFIIVSYNILGDENVSKHSDLYSNVPPEHLYWEKRKSRICKELRSYSPSILCFQEVDHYDELADLLHKDGYTGVYKGRTGCARDGCAIFWKEERFSLLYEESIEYQKFGLRDNVAQLCLLQVSGDDSNHLTTGNTNPSSAGNMMLLVGNIHVLFNPNRGDIKLGQIRLLLERANTISQNWGNPSMVICGDLNSIPKSAIYRFISSPELDILKYERKKVSGQIELQSRNERHTSCKDGSRSISCMGKLLRYSWSEEEICIAAGNRGCTLLQNPLKLSSAYTGVPGNLLTRDSNGEPLVTSFHSKFMGTVDYIWHSSDLLPVRVLETLPINELKELGCLPCEIDLLLGIDKQKGLVYKKCPCIQNSTKMHSAFCTRPSSSTLEPQGKPIPYSFPKKVAKEEVLKAIMTWTLCSLGALTEINGVATICHWFANLPSQMVRVMTGREACTACT